jgi:hypothetical protein
MVASRSLRASDCSSAFPHDESERRLDAIHKLGSVDFTYAFSIFEIEGTIRRIRVASTCVVGLDLSQDPQEEQA